MACYIYGQPARGFGWTPLLQRTQLSGTRRYFCSRRCQRIHRQTTNKGKTMVDDDALLHFSNQVTEQIDQALEAVERNKTPRNYLGASRLGEECQRRLQYEYWHQPVDKGQHFQGRTLRIFQFGHSFETLAIDWLRQAGFDLYTETRDGGQFGFQALDGTLRGHVDGIFNGGPAAIAMTYPALWECKSMNSRSWKDTVKKGVTISKPVYAAQMALYQAYMEEQVPGISQHPALFTAVNKDTCELYFEQVPFDQGLAQRSSDKAVKILQACDAGELLPRISSDAGHYICKMCPWQQQCWEVSS